MSETTDTSNERGAPMKRILFPVEDLNISDKTLALAVELGQNSGAEILILHVQPYNELTSYPYARLVEPWEQEAFNLASEQIVENAVKKFVESGLVVSTRIVSGDPAHEILECAEKENCDMIIISTHGMSTLRRFTLGSVTNKVVLHANIPVLIVR